MKGTTASAILGIGLGLVIVHFAAPNWRRPEMVNRRPIDYSKYYVLDENIEEQVLGVDYGGSVVTYDPWVPELAEMEMTYYTDKGTCADGITKARKGVCAVQKDLIGMTAIVRTVNEELIGIYECCDTGYGRKEENGKGTIQNGHCIDIFFPTDEEGQAFIQKYGNRVKQLLLTQIIQRQHHILLV